MKTKLQNKTRNQHQSEQRLANPAEAQARILTHRRRGLPSLSSELPAFDLSVQHTKDMKISILCAGQCSCAAVLGGLFGVLERAYVSTPIRDICTSYHCCMNATAGIRLNTGCSKQDAGNCADASSELHLAQSCTVACQPPVYLLQLPCCALLFAFAVSQTRWGQPGMVFAGSAMNWHLG